MNLPLPLKIRILTVPGTSTERCVQHSPGAYLNLMPGFPCCKQGPSTVCTTPARIINKGTNKGRGFWIAPSHWLPDARHVSADSLQAGQNLSLQLHHPHLNAAKTIERPHFERPHCCLMVCSTQCYNFLFLTWNIISIGLDLHSHITYRANIVVCLLCLYLGIERETL